MKLWKTQLHKVGQPAGFLGRFVGTLLKTGLSLIGNIFKPFTKSVLIPSGSIAAATATDRFIYKKVFRSGTKTIIFNEEMNYIIKIVKFLEESSLLIKDVSETIKHEAKE